MNSIKQKILVTGGSGFIGTNLIEFILLNRSNINVLNLDISKPKLKTHDKYWIKCDINDLKALESFINDYSPDYLIHLAAETNVKFSKLSDFQTNIKGVENICKVVNKSASVKRVIFTSTQYVHQFHGQPNSDDEYFPFTKYGESKVEGEKIVRQFNLNKEWVIIRPTNIYGPYNDIYVKGLFRVIQNGYYFHPNIDVIRSYGYVETVVQQILKILELSSTLVNKKTFYVGDEPINLQSFVLEIHKNFGKNRLKILPIWVFYLAAVIGEFVSKFNIPFPMNKIRYINMVTPNPINMQRTFQILNHGNLDIKMAIKNTINWYFQSEDKTL
ncbi:NAD-dependent epimerase/dehydratase family protein [Stygiobacter electus]|uniref:NAD(P)-dependent oxidoreductase n=1 Tax=Stygiobacter electus TaxID=3032292 RepID=A0AAE3NZW0_9BACT|nr:NAD(P)-dependent oxidoreductase [Stygiobacter electus]MDF1613101.1 NAD(P)-dependent oxidoreductase [Stygiobacter electus]